MVSPFSGWFQEKLRGNLSHFRGQYFDGQKVCKAWHHAGLALLDSCVDAENVVQVSLILAVLWLLRRFHRSITPERDFRGPV